MKRHMASALAVAALALLLLGVGLKQAQGAPPAQVGSPDLIVTDVWYEQGDICYQVRNIGEGEASAGHETGLLLDGQTIVQHAITKTLAPGERARGCFVFGWQCSWPDDLIGACADVQQTLTESDENNNCRAETWRCDATPPSITQGPKVAEVLQTGAVITWTTDEASDSQVSYGRYVDRFEGQQSATPLVLNHAITLTGLQPATAYRFVISSTDMASNTVTSGSGFFETLPPTDTAAPVISAFTATREAGDLLHYTLEATVSDTVGVDRVAFYLDGQLIGVDYTGATPANAVQAPGTPMHYQIPLIPAAMGIQRGSFFQDHVIRAVALDKGGLMRFLDFDFNPTYECDDIGADIEYPYRGYTYYIDGSTVPAGETLAVDVYAQEYDFGCRWVPGGTPGTPNYICTTDYYPVEQVELYVNTALEQTETTPHHGAVYRFDWDIGGLGPGTYALRVDAVASEACKQTLTRDVEFVIGEPRLDVSRDVTRNGNTFEVELTVRNRGTASTAFHRVEDVLTGVQPIVADGSNFRMTADCADDGTRCTIDLDAFDSGGADAVALGPGDRFSMVYTVVPVYYSDDLDVAHAIGAEPVRIFDIGDTEIQAFDRPCVTVESGHSLDEALDWALWGTNYIILTSPERLYDNHTDTHVDELLSLMADFALEHAGVLVYVSDAVAGDVHAVRSTYTALGAEMRGSSGAAGTDYLSDGYLLIVGEAEIIAAWDVHYNYRDIPWSDLPYGNTAGETTVPELVVGRIIGDNPNELRIPLETSLGVARGTAGYGFDRSHALAVSGRGSGVTAFERNVDDVADILNDEFAVRTFKQRDVEDDGLNMTFVFTTNVAGRDMIYYRDHCNHDHWSGAIDEDQFPIDFDGANPFVFAACCTAGRYENVEDTSIAEAFLQNGTGVYIGATRVSLRYSNNVASREFLENWVGSSKSIGKAFRDFKRGYTYSYEDLWKAEYNLYGDPKFGANPPLALAAPTPLAATPPVTALDVVVPDYVVTTTADGEHVVTLPGGAALLETDQPIVPYYVQRVDYAPGYRVQDVTLRTRDGLTTSTGLSLTINTLHWDGPLSAAQSSDGEQDWWPTGEFDWTVVEKPDGTTELYVALYPFYYNPRTTDVRFYQQYAFDIDVISSTVRISALDTDADVYDLGDVAVISLWLENSGDPVDVLVSVVFRDENTGAAIGSPQLRSLKDLAGLTSFSLDQEISEGAVGAYLVEATVRDAASGAVLDQASQRVQLGTVAGALADFAVTPQSFVAGDTLTVSLTFSNTGTVPVSGTAVIHIYDADGAAVETFERDTPVLAPAGAHRVDESWDTSGVSYGRYTVAGHVLYNSAATSAQEVTVTYPQRLYLPTVLRAGP